VRDLSEIRVDIDVLDQEILNLYMKRMDLAAEVADYKMANHKPVLDVSRENDKLEKLSSMVEDADNKQGIRELFSQIMSQSRKKQYRLLGDNEGEEPFGFSMREELPLKDATVVYQGVEGAYSHIASMEFFPEAKSLYNVKSWRDAFLELQNHKADYAVLPIENSRAGAVTEIYDLLHEFPGWIVGEKVLPVRHVLYGVGELSQITDIYSHPQALMQCSEFLQKENASIHVHSVPNTAMAAKKVMELNDPSCGAICSPLCGELYHLNPLATEIGDDPDNKTRFLIISSQSMYLKESNCVSISFELPDNTGSLYHILSHFIFNGLNMSRIESRPIIGKDWEYRFFVDFEGNLSQKEVISAILGLKEETQSFRILGNFPA